MFWDCGVYFYTLAGLLLAVFLHCWWNVRQFSKRGVPCSWPVPLLGNNASLLTGKVVTSHIIDIYNKFRGHPFAGIFEFTLRVIMIRDPEVIKLITVKDFDHFVDHRTTVPENVEPMLERNLVNLKGNRWKTIRNILTPSFTSSKMKFLFQLVTECGKQLAGHVEGQINKQELSDEDIAAQAFLFFSAGFDTTSTLLCFATILLAVHPEVQEKLQAEIVDTFHGDEQAITYEALHGMSYLDMVLSETLRLYPPLSMVDRMCVKTYTVPATEDRLQLTIEKGELVMLPVVALHRDPEYFPDPDSFKPERFSEENKHNMKPFTYLPFGVGPRSCIGNRLALMEAKVALVLILSRFSFEVVDKTPLPIKVTNTMDIQGGFWLGLKHRKINN